MKPSTVLRDAKALISSPERWIQGEEARDSRGGSCNCTSGEAVCWCLIGAICRAAPGRRAAPCAACRFVEAVIGASLVKWNDDRNRKHAEVLEALDKAIALAEQAGE